MNLLPQHAIFNYIFRRATWFRLSDKLYKVKKILKRVLYTIISLFSFFSVSYGEDGYDLWLRYKPIAGEEHRQQTEDLFRKVVLNEPSSTTYAIIKSELERAVSGMINGEVEFSMGITSDASLVIGTPDDMEVLQNEAMKLQLKSVGEDGFIIYRMNNPSNAVAIIANSPVGALYGMFHLLREVQIQPDIQPLLPIVSAPEISERILNHWDNLDRTVERGYAGFSIWDWHKLPDYIDQRYIDYARANASVGINGTVLTNVNANALVLTPSYIAKVKSLADIFRPYGIKVYLTARFSSPIEIGGLETADPLDNEVQEWWKDKVKEIYASIPDFGGFLVKANSEGQPGPQNYGRSHADGANMLANALKPFGGIVMWRAFVYSAEVPEDRAKQAYNEFEPLDGKFADNVFVQVKNGPIDFQPREPFHPLFGAMKQTKLALEFQITMEYLGQATNLVYLAPLFKECLDSGTGRPYPGSTVASVIDGSDFGQKHSVIAGVSNIGTDRNWTGHPFGQSNWYAFGRLAWDHALTPDQIAQEWIGLTFGNDQELMKEISEIMLHSWETTISYSTPLGLHHIMGRGHHYGPGPWVEGGRPDWTAVYYHRADSLGIGFDRTSRGSNALSQYAPQIGARWENLQTCPDQYLLWFHHLPWDYAMRSGKSLWEELCLHYDSGVKEVGEMREQWTGLKNKIDDDRFNQVSMLLGIQEKEARWWKNSCLLYFQTFSKMKFPDGMKPPTGTLEYYESLEFPYAPGIRPTW
jgi:alpha-glucuronidase